MSQSTVITIELEGGEQLALTYKEGEAITTAKGNGRIVSIGKPSGNPGMACETALTQWLAARQQHQKLRLEADGSFQVATEHAVAVIGQNGGEGQARYNGVTYRAIVADGMLKVEEA